MKRDMELVRKIVLHLEKPPRKTPRLDELHIEGYELKAVNYHVRLLYDGGLIMNKAHPDRELEHRCTLSLTWVGHDFLDAARNDTIWQGAKERLGEAFASAPFEVVKAALEQGMKSAVGLD